MVSESETGINRLWQGCEPLAKMVGWKAGEGGPGGWPKMTGRMTPTPGFSKSLIRIILLIKYRPVKRKLTKRSDQTRNTHQLSDTGP